VKTELLHAALHTLGRRIDEPRVELADRIGLVTPTEAALTICELVVALELSHLQLTVERLQIRRAA